MIAYTFCHLIEDSFTIKNVWLERDKKVENFWNFPEILEACQCFFGKIWVIFHPFATIFLNK